MSLNPTLGREIHGTRPVLVLSADAFNAASGLLLVVPITQGGSLTRNSGFSVTLMGAGTRTMGVICCDQSRTIDARARKFKRIERAPVHVVDEALDALRSILE